MKIFEHIPAIQSYLKSLRDNKMSIGFVPTMGALHKGHLSLINQAKKENDVVVCSIFVNPIQFNNKEDLKKYPRNLDKDIKLLEEVQCDILFAPSETEMYPEENTKVYGLNGLDTLMEGKYRPGHFNGVAVVVEKLFSIIQPNKAYFGEKDYQQLIIIKHIVKEHAIPVIIIPCPILREEDGLAMSSRNTRLSPEERTIAPFIYQTLIKAKEKVNILTVFQLKNWVEEQFTKQPLLKLEYFEIVDSQTLLPIQNWQTTSPSIACIAVFLGAVRLIDNIKL